MRGGHAASRPRRARMRRASRRASRCRASARAARVSASAIDRGHVRRARVRHVDDERRCRRDASSPQRASSIVPLRDAARARTMPRSRCRRSDTQSSAGSAISQHAMSARMPDAMRAAIAQAERARRDARSRRPAPPPASGRNSVHAMLSISSSDVDGRRAGVAVGRDRHRHAAARATPRSAAAASRAARRTRRAAARRPFPPAAIAATPASLVYSR